jgi:RNA polymerase sigma factor (sigma-70 family)
MEEVPMKKIKVAFSVAIAIGQLFAMSARAQDAAPAREIEIVVHGGYQPNRITITEGERVRLRFVRHEYSSCTRGRVPRARYPARASPASPRRHRAPGATARRVRVPLRHEHGARYDRGGGESAMNEQEDAVEPQTPALVNVLVENHRELLAFLERRTGDRALAEDILQDAFVRSIDKVGALRDDAAIVPWFYRMLRNAIVDHQRRRGTASKALGDLATELETTNAGTETHGAVCQCVAKLTETLKPEYADALKRIEIDGLAVKDYADEAGITSNNAGVRVFRARDALRKQVQKACGTCATHGCVDCTCGTR